jgi:signal peptidase I
MPGDRLKLVNKNLWLNGKQMNEPYVRHTTDYMDSYRDNFPAEPNVNLEPQGIWMLQHHVQHGEVVVPPGNYFLLGDNRDASLDSRYWGFVTKEDFVGRPVLVMGKGNSALLHYPLGN